MVSNHGLKRRRLVKITGASAVPALVSPSTAKENKPTNEKTPDININNTTEDNHRITTTLYKYNGDEWSKVFKNSMDMNPKEDRAFSGRINNPQNHYSIKIELNDERSRNQLVSAAGRPRFGLFITIYGETQFSNQVQHLDGWRGEN